MAVEADLLESIGGREGKALAQATTFDTLLIGARLLMDPEYICSHDRNIVRIMGFVTLVVYYTEINESESAANEVTFLVNTGDTCRTKA